MKTNYKIVEFKQIPANKLHPHPAAEIVMDEEDTNSLAMSIEEHGGVLAPLHVIKDGGQYAVIDGCSRLRQAAAQGIKQLPCLVVEAEDVRSLALTFLGAGRKRTTGQRLTAFIEAHRDEVLRVARIVKSVNSPFKTSREVLKAKPCLGADPKDCITEYSAAWIAKRFKCSEDDAQYAVKLLLAKVAAEESADADRLAHVNKIYNNVLGGVTPVRRCMGGINSKLTPRARKGENLKSRRAEHKRLFLRCLQELTHHMAHKDGVYWSRWSVDEQREVSDKWRESLQKFPDQLLKIAAELAEERDV